MNGFSFDVEILLLAQRRGYHIAEVSVDWTHQPGSRINLVTDSLRMAFDLIRIRARLLTERIDTVGQLFRPTATTDSPYLKGRGFGPASRFRSDAKMRRSVLLIGAAGTGRSVPPD